MKRVLSVLLFALLTFSLFSCAAAEEEELFEIDPGFIVGSDETTDFNGYKLKMSSDYTKDSMTILGYDRDTFFGDLALQRIRDTEKKFNIEITPVKQDFYNGCKLSAASGDQFCDFGMASSFTLVGNGTIRGGYLYGMTELEQYINWRDTEKWGNPVQLESLLWKDDLYGVVPMLWPEYSFNWCNYGIFVNEKYINELGEADPRDYVENGEWTRDKFSQVVKDYTFTNSDNVTVPGLVVNFSHFMTACLTSNGVEYAVKKNGEWVSGYSTVEGQEALQWGYNFLFVENRPYIKNFATYDAVNNFVEEKATMLMTHAYIAFTPQNSSTAKSVVYNIENFAVLPFPCGPNVEYGTWAGIHESADHVVAFPISNTEPSVAAIVANAMFEPFEGYESQEALQEYYGSYTVHDPRDAAVIMKMIENSHYTYVANDAQATVSQIAQSNGLCSVTQAIEANREKFESTIASSIAPAKDAVEVLWGSEYAE